MTEPELSFEKCAEDLEVWFTRYNTAEDPFLRNTAAMTAAYFVNLVQTIKQIDKKENES